MLPQLFGYLSGLAIILSFIPYIRGILQNRTKPERASWFIWTLLGLIFFFSNLAKGATNSLWLPAFQALGDALIFILAIKYGFGGFMKRDILALAGAALSLALWYFTREPAVALFLVIIIDGLGAVLTILKSYEHPATEPLSSWILTALGGLFAIFAVGTFNWILLAFPIYIFAANTGIILSIVAGRRKLSSNF